jgi:hypothetical protein
VNQSEVNLNAQLFLAPLILSVPPNIVKASYLEMEFAPTALSTPHVIMVMSVRLRLTSTRLKVTST